MSEFLSVAAPVAAFWLLYLLVGAVVVGVPTRLGFKWSPSFGKDCETFVILLWPGLLTALAVFGVLWLFVVLAKFIGGNLRDR